MDSNKIFDVIQQGFRTVVGATTTIVETIQDPQKREETLSQLNQDWAKKTEDWAKKGEITEQEARRMMENFLQKQRENRDENTSNRNDSDSVSNVSYYNQNPVKEIQELTETIISLRIDLEQANKSEIK